jgi:cytochrome c peroxidase
MRWLHFMPTLVCLAMLGSQALAAGYATEASLGRALFEDVNLSSDRSVACASCHRSVHAFADTRSVSLGVLKRAGTRNAPSLLDLALYRSYFWDGRARTLEEQLRFPISNSAEMNFSADEDFLNRIRESPDYVQAFGKLQGVADAQALRFSNVSRALIAYERSLSSASVLDRYLFSRQTTALSPTAQAGLEVFRGKGLCNTCHLITAHEAPLTDAEFHLSGLGLHQSGAELARLAKELTALPASERYDRVQHDSRTAGLGRFVVTLEPRDIGKFRTPSLRHVALTAPYMHDGSIATLGEAVDLELYIRGLDAGHPIIIPDEDKKALVIFLREISRSPAQQQEYGR